MRTKEMHSVDRLVHQAREHLVRVEPADYESVVADGALVVDVRPLEIRQTEGDLPHASLVVGLNVLEWRLAPDSPYRIVDVGPDQVVLLVCQQGFSSSLAAFRLQQVGIRRATDLIGGHQALMRYRETLSSSAEAPVALP